MVCAAGRGQRLRRRRRSGRCPRPGCSSCRPDTSTSAAQRARACRPCPAASSSTWCCGAAMLRTPYSRSNNSNRSCAVSSLPVASITRLHHLAELDLQAARQLQAVLALEQVGDAALARLAVDADHGLVAAAQVLGIDRQIRHVPDVAFLARGEGLLDRVLVRAGERGVDQVAGIRMARMHRQLVAVLDGRGGSRRCRRSRARARRPACRGSARRSRGRGCRCARRCRTGSPRGGRRRPSARIRRQPCRCRDRCADGPTARWHRAAPGCGASTRSCRRRCWASNAPPSTAG